MLLCGLEAIFQQWLTDWNIPQYWRSLFCLVVVIPSIKFSCTFHRNTRHADKHPDSSTRSSDPTWTN